MSYYKEAMRRKQEIPVSSCPVQVTHHLYSGQHLKDEDAEQTFFDEMLSRLDENGPPMLREDRPKKNKYAGYETRHQKLVRIRKRHSGAAFSFSYVDTENAFVYEGRWYVIDVSVQAYAPKQTRCGELYDADQIMVVQSPDGTLDFYTQDLTAISPNMVTVT